MSETRQNNPLIDLVEWYEQWTTIEASFKRTEDTLRQEFGKEPEELFSSLKLGDYREFATAMISRAERAEKTMGDEDEWEKVRTYALALVDHADSIGEEHGDESPCDAYSGHLVTMILQWLTPIYFEDAAENLAKLRVKASEAHAARNRAGIPKCDELIRHLREARRDTDKVEACYRRVARHYSKNGKSPHINTIKNWINHHKIEPDQWDTDNQN